MIMDTKLLHGDCLIESDNIESGSVDLILADLPYGKMNGFNGIDWDFAIDPKKVYEIANRVLRKNGKMVLFSQEPYTGQLTTQAIPNVPFSYRAVWEKDNFANALGVNKSMVSFYEDILVFSKKNPVHDCEFTHPLRPYFKLVMDYIGLTLGQINKRLGHGRAEHTFRVDTSQFSLCTEATYNELIQVFGIDNMNGYMEFAELQKIDLPYKSNPNSEINSVYPSTFNLWEGNKYKSNILKYKKDYGGLHPTQKPILLLEDLIKTFSNEGDLVVDLTMGSGSTGVACMNTKRNFIGIELDDKYFEIAKRRISEARNKPEQIVKSPL